MSFAVLSPLARLRPVTAGASSGGACHDALRQIIALPRRPLVAARARIAQMEREAASFATFRVLVNTGPSSAERTGSPKRRTNDGHEAGAKHLRYAADRQKIRACFAPHNQTFDEFAANSKKPTFVHVGSGCPIMGPIVVRSRKSDRPRLHRFPSPRHD